jgi:hypothetical protein
VVLLASPALAADDVLFPIYQQYQKAVAQGDAAGAKFYLSEGKRAQLAGKSSEEALSEMNVLSPKEKLRRHEEIFDGEDATLVVRAVVMENDSTGRIQFVREGGTWKILSEMWDIGGAPEDAGPSKVIQPKTPEQRAAIRKLREKGFPQPTADFLVMTAGTGDLEAVKLFVAAGYSVDTTEGGTPAIVNAASSGHGAVVLYLIEQGANVNAEDEVHTTALMRIADKCDKTDVVRALLKAGAKTDIQSAGSATALQFAEWSNCTENAEAIRGAATQ